MPAKKPQGLHTRHSTKSEKEQRTAEEELLRSKRRLPQEPARLEGHARASAVWRRLLKEFDGLEAEIITRLDMDLLLDYCILAEQVEELDELRSAAYATWGVFMRAFEEVKGLDPLEASKQAGKVADAFEHIIKIDGRADRKRSLLLQLRQSMYLTPRARAGAAPKSKEPEEEPDDFEKILNGVNEFIQSGGS